jgi:gluconolactonase
MFPVTTRQSDGMSPVAATARVRVQELSRVVQTDAHEGPVYLPGEDTLYFTTQRPDVAINRLALDGSRFPLEPSRITTVRAAANVANGMTLDADGRLVVCEQGTLCQPAGITRVDRVTRGAEAVVDEWLGLRLNSPNDVVVKRDGRIWFTDPSYGYLQGFRPAPQVGDQVYRYDPCSGALSVVADGFDKPNGLAFSPHEDVLYVGDNGDLHHIVAFDVLDGRRLTRAGSRREHARAPRRPQDRRRRTRLRVGGGARPDLRCERRPARDDRAAGSRQLHFSVGPRATSSSSPQTTRSGRPSSTPAHRPDAVDPLCHRHGRIEFGWTVASVAGRLDSGCRISVSSGRRRPSMRSSSWRGCATATSRPSRRSWRVTTAR